MADVKLSPKQQCAVDHRGSALLVSAAAGSGKTKVLVSRLLSHICDPEQPKNVDDFLLITYTKKAAAELRSKIIEEIGARLAERPHDRHLQAQRSRVYLAKISTVHSFCGDMLRQYAHVLGLPPDFATGEETQCRKLSEYAMQQTLDEAYAHILDWPDVRAFIDTLAAGRDDRAVPQLLEQVDRAMQCQLDPEAWAKRVEAMPEGPLEQTPAGAYLMARFRRQMLQVAALAEQAMAICCQDALLEEKQRPVLEEDLRILSDLALCESWDAVCRRADVTFPKLATIKTSAAPACYEQLKRLRESYKKQLKALCSPFLDPADALMEELRASQPAVRGLMQLTRRYQANYLSERRRRKLLDFSDLEHEMLRLVRDARTGAPTAQGREISGRFCEIMVDEYQDSNAIQDAIFTSISQGQKNLFFVGDVKQSIYRFRQAEPEIFLKKYHSYSDDPAPGAPRRVLLSENFRSRPEILDACNAVFSAVMSEDVGDLAYTENEALHPGLPSYPDLPDPAVELHVLQTGGDAEEDEESPGKLRAEAELAADRIVQMLREKTLVSAKGELRPVEPQDFAILLRSMKNKAPVVMAALHSRGIPVACAMDEDILDTTEVAVVLSLLRVIDNPCQDIPLLSALCSPLGGFSADAVAKIRAAHREGCLYDALCASQDPDAQRFAAQVERYRFLLDQCRVGELLETILADCHAELIFGAMENGVRRLENLHTLRAFVQAQNAVGCGGLMELLGRIDSLRAAGKRITSDADSRPSGAVNLMTIHTSKGLEFPVVILMDLSKKFNTDDTNRRVLTDETLGVGIDVLDTELRAMYPTVLKKAIRAKKLDEGRSEELRVLYVAMTRAVDRLLLFYTEKSVRSTLEGFALQAARPMPASCTAAVTRPGDWVLMTALLRSEAGELFRLTGPCWAARVSEYPWRIQLHALGGAAAQPLPAGRAADLTLPALPDAAELEARLAFRYPHAAAAASPAKLTATQMKGRDLDAEAEAETRKPLRTLHFRRPQFDTHALSPTERGNAAHLFMQFADYASCTTPEGIQAEIARLRTEKFLTPQQADAVEPEAILTLFTSPLGVQILQSPDLLREFKFSLYLDGAVQDPALEGEQIFLQGVVDCSLNEPDGLTIIDFKTDRVTEETIEARAASYAGQVRTYAAAMRRIFEKPVKRTLLYFFSAGRTVEVKE